MIFDHADWFPVGKLCDRYNRSPSVLSKRIKELGITAHKVGIRKFVSTAQLLLLDEHDAFTKAGGTTAEFIFYKGLNRPDEE